MSTSRILMNSLGRRVAARNFHTTPRRLADAVPLPAKKPMGAFRGG